MSIRALVVAVCLMAANAFAETHPRIDRVEPFRLQVQSSGWARIEMHGLYPHLEASIDMDQYEHWFVRRAGGEWQRCTRTSDSCRPATWHKTMQSLELEASRWLTTPGTIEIRMNEGLSGDGNSTWPFSNIATVPVLAAFGAPPVIGSVSKQKFIAGAAEAEYVFRINGNNFDPASLMVVFGSTVAVRPLRVVEGTQVEVAVPAEFRNRDGLVTVQLRTDSGGLSETAYVAVAEIKPLATIPGAVLKGPRPGAAVPRAPIAPITLAPDVALAGRVRTAIAAKIGADAAGRITVEAKGTLVTLGGTAGSREIRAAAEAAAASVANVTRVANGINTP